MAFTLILALGACFIRWTLHDNGTITVGTDFMPVHLLLLLLVIFMAGREAMKKDASVHVPGLFRHGFRAGVIYTVIVAAFAYVLYTWLDPTFFPIKVNALIDEAVKQGREPAEARERIGSFYTPFLYATMTLSAFLILSALNAIVCAIVHHKFLRKVR